MSKRRETAKRLGRKWKEKGHAYENLFNAAFDNRRKINYSKPTSDCTVDDATLRELASLWPGKRSVSLKSSSTATFHLGNIPELSDKPSYQASLHKKVVGKKMATCGIHSKSWEEQLAALKNPKFWHRYLLAKGELYVQLQEDRKTYVFFAMEDVISLICEKAEWRLLETGRIKGDLPIVTDKGAIRKAAVLTFEYKSFALGFHSGNNAYVFCEVLKQHLQHKSIVQ